MSAGSDAQLVREFLRAELPLLPGAYPGRPAPGHIANNFATLALGSGADTAQFTRMLALGDGLDQLLTSGSKRQEQEVTRLMLKSTFDADNNVFRAFSSPFAVHADVVGTDPTDDRYARGLWQALGEGHREELSILLRALLRPEVCNDVVSQIADAFRTHTEPRESSPPQDWTGSSDFGHRAGDVLVAGLRKAVACADDARRLEEIRRLSIMLSTLVILGLLFDGARADKHGLVRGSSTESAHPGSILGVLVYTGMTPGAVNNSLVAFCVRSIDDAVVRAHSGIAKTFGTVLSARMQAARRRSKKDALNDAVADRLGGKPAADLLKRLVNEDATNDPEAVGRRLLALPHLRLSVKSLGYKTGLSAPQRKGALRFLLETNLLTALVAYLATDGMTVQQFVDRVYNTLGLILGSPTDLHEETYSRLELLGGNNFDVDQSLADAQELLRIRLVRSGLAREFSDGYTILEEH